MARFSPFFNPAIHRCHLDRGNGIGSGLTISEASEGLVSALWSSSSWVGELEGQPGAFSMSVWFILGDYRTRSVAFDVCFSMGQC